MPKPFNLKIPRSVTLSGGFNRKQSKTMYLIQRIIVTNVISLIILGVTYAWVVYLLSNANSFWDIFRGKDVYVDVDKVPPITPYLNPVSEATKNDFVDISGRAESGVKIILNIDGNKAQETVTDGEGQFSFTGIAVGISDQEINVVAQDNAGNVSKASQSYKIHKDTEAPEIEIITPKEGETFENTGRTYRVTGKTETGATVTVNEQLAMVALSGEFSVSIRLEEGENKLKFKVTDKAGNEKEEERKMFYKKVD